MIKRFGIIYAILVTQLIAAPEGFSIVSSEGGVTVYTKLLKIKDAKPDYVQEIDLSKGAKIKLLMGEIVEERKRWGKHNGQNPKIKRQSLQQVWEEAKENNNDTVCVTNGQFFGTGGYPTTLAFPIKIDGIDYDGYEEVYEDKHKVLNIGSNNVEINQFSYDDMSYLKKNAIVGFSTSANKSKNSNVGRTFIGIADKNEDGISETILIFNSKYSTQKYAKKTLIAFGATDIMMLDGGDSSQLICNGTDYVSSSRTIPQSIATIKAEKKTFSYRDKVDFVFDGLEKRHSFYFPKGSKTQKSGGNFYRTYKVRGKSHILYAYNKKIYYNLGSGYKFYNSVDTWYNYFNR